MRFRMKSLPSTLASSKGLVLSRNGRCRTSHALVISALFERYEIDSNAVLVRRELQFT